MKYIYFLDLCECGCGNMVYGNNRFIHNHHTKGKRMFKISQSLFGNNRRKGCKLSIEHNKKLHTANIGNQYMKNHIDSEETTYKKSESHYGERNPSWIDGRSYLPYSHKFNLKLKEGIRERDNHKCMLCGKLETEEILKIKRKLPIHHIDYNKNNCEENNLIALCCKCNSIANFNRNYYKNLFNKIIEITYFH